MNDEDKVCRCGPSASVPSISKALVGWKAKSGHVDRVIGIASGRRPRLDGPRSSFDSLPQPLRLSSPRSMR